MQFAIAHPEPEYNLVSKAESVNILVRIYEYVLVSVLLNFEAKNFIEFD